MTREIRVIVIIIYELKLHFPLEIACLLTNSNDAQKRKTKSGS